MQAYRHQAPGKISAVQKVWPKIFQEPDRHPNLPGSVVLTTQGSPLMQRLLRYHPLHDSMVYDAERRWFVMTNDTYRMLKETVPMTTLQQISEVPVTKKRRTIVRTVSVQTEDKIRISAASQTTEEDVAPPISCVAAGG